jgi:hypothetical protein
MEAEFAAKWQARADIGPLPRQALRAIHDLILATGAPVPVAAVAATLPGEKPGAVAEAVATLDERDLIAMSDGHVVLAYPLAARPTRFEVHLPDGRVRHAVCAIDALGLPALLGEPVGIRSTCLHCQEPVVIDARPDRPMGAADIMVWIGERDRLRAKAWSGL